MEAVRLLSAFDAHNEVTLSPKQLPFDDDEMSLMASCIVSAMGGRWVEVSVERTRFRTLDAIRTSPRSYSFVIGMIAELAADTLMVEDLPRLVENACSAALADGVPIRDIYAYIIGWAYSCPFEPSWHMRRRGATERLDDRLWRYLRNLYIGRNDGSLTHPQFVLDAMRDVKGYRKLIALATDETRANHEYLYTQVDSLGNVMESREKKVMKRHKTERMMDGSGGEHSFEDIENLRNKLSLVSEL